MWNNLVLRQVKTAEKANEIIVKTALLNIQKIVVIRNLKKNYLENNSCKKLTCIIKTYGIGSFTNNETETVKATQ